MTREQQPDLPITPREIADEVAWAARRGAWLVHFHARRDDGRPTTGASKADAA